MDAIWDLPLALVSFAFYKVMRFIMRRLVVLNARRKGKLAYVWGVVSGETLSMKMALPAIMTTAPRWNTHAIIGGAGPFAVKESVSFELEPLQASAKSWTIAVYTFPHQKVAAIAGSIDAPFPNRRHTVKLPPGNYNMVARLYHRSEKIVLPEIGIDGVAAIPSYAVNPHTNDFYYELPKRRSWFYLCLHFYIYTLLRLRAPRWMVEPELLPMGNPETSFSYGAVKRGEALRFRIPAELVAAHDIYFTLYTRDSFPALWYPILKSEHETEPAVESGFYLLRVQRKVAGARKAEPGSIECVVKSAGRG